MKSCMQWNPVYGSKISGSSGARTWDHWINGPGLNILRYQGSYTGWMICDFTAFSTVFQSYQYNSRMIMLGWVQLCEPCLQLRRFHPESGVNPGLLDQSELPGLWLYWMLYTMDD